jgi:hypothetical protein
MAEPSCLRFGNNQFQITPVELRSPRHRHSLVHCGECGGVIGVIDELNVEATLEEARGFIQRQFSVLRDRLRPARNGKQEQSLPQQQPQP